MKNEREIKELLKNVKAREHQATMRGDRGVASMYDYGIGILEHILGVYEPTTPSSDECSCIEDMGVSFDCAIHGDNPIPHALQPNPHHTGDCHPDCACRKTDSDPNLI